MLTLKKRCAVFLLAGLCIAAVPPTAQGSGSLDRSFGVNGRVLTPLLEPRDPSHFPEPQMAPAGAGRTLVAWGRELLRYRPDGSLDPSFGHDGRLPIAIPPGVAFQLVDVAVDSKGRIVIVGSAAHQQLPGEVNYGPETAGPRYALIIRYLADGRLDSSFGAGTGIVETGLGVPPAAPGYGTTPDPPFVIPSGVVIDSQDRIVLSGNYLKSTVACTATSLRAVDAGFIARLSPDGSLDPGFARGGLRLFPGRELDTPVAAARRGALRVLATRTSYCGSGPTFLGRVAADGGNDRSFGAPGWRRLDFSPSVLAIDSQDRVLALTWVKGGSGRHPGSAVAQVRRFSADGGIDSGFGRDGRANLLVPGHRSTLRRIAIAPDGSVLLVGSHLHPRGHPPGATFMVMRLDRKGRWDRGFGPDGRIETRFGIGSSAGASDAMLDSHGRLLVAGATTTPRFATGAGIALARYLVTPRTKD